MRRTLAWIDAHYWMKQLDDFIPSVGLLEADAGEIYIWHHMGGWIGFDVQISVRHSEHHDYHHRHHHSPCPHHRHDHHHHVHPHRRFHHGGGHGHRRHHHHHHHHHPPLPHAWNSRQAQEKIFKMQLNLCCLRASKSPS